MYTYKELVCIYFLLELNFTVVLAMYFKNVFIFQRSPVKFRSIIRVK